MSVDKGKTCAVPPPALRKLGEGCRSKRFQPRCSIRQQSSDSEDGAPVSPGARMEDKADSAAAAAPALQEGYRYRRPVPLPDDDDEDTNLETPEDGKASALLELEAGLAAAADGPPHKADDEGGEDAGADGDGGADAGARDDDEDDGMSTAHSSSSSSSSLDTEDVVAFAVEWDDEDGNAAGGQKSTVKKLACSHDPAEFQEEQESARSLLAMGAFFVGTAKNMFEEHKRARKEADMYLDEVT